MDQLTPQSLDLEKLEKFQKKMLKQLMSLPTNTPDPAINILTGILPVDAQIHLKEKYIQYCESSTNLKRQQRVPTKIKLLTGTYILQPLRYKIYKEGTKDHCIACDCKEETLEHLLIECEAWNYLRDPILQTIKNLLTTNGNVRVEDLTCEMTIQVLMDITKIQKIYRITSDLISQIHVEFQST
ncbi:unnamed protein product [Mytilus edulis]|uniref:Reverse transcriptase zinc-binding domain-containing protein n=1 Tax=Mytilus edulis TaxID=6550 RepID=A0A8S3S3M4_MYTED|nr:unnamed protein product [Mytilus edulis]